jgi:hypothetical protein
MGVRFGLVTLLSCIGMAMTTGQQKHEIAVGDVLVFSSPVEMAPVAAQGIDSAVNEWRGEQLLVRTDYGLFVDPLTGYKNRPNLQVFEEPIDGQPARAVTFDQADGSRFTAVHFPDLGRLGAAPKKLTLVVISSGRRSADDEGLQIVRSIRFRR